jgi:hypothetical protein
VRIIAQAVRRESEIKLTFRLNVVGKTPNRGEVCLSLREWREVELTYPRKEVYCGKNCRMDQCILLDGLETVAFTTSAWPMPVLFREKLCEMAAPYRSAWHFGPMCERADQLWPKARELDELIKKLSERVSRPLTLSFLATVFCIAGFRAHRE